MKSSTEMQQILKERYGISDIENSVAGDPWSVHLANADDEALAAADPVTGKPRRLVQTFLYYRPSGTLQDNQYAHPIDIVPVVDLNSKTIVHIDGLDRPAPKIPDIPVQYHRDKLAENSYLQTTWRTDTLKALHITQPDGPSFRVTDGNLVEWQGWSLRVGFHYREGLVLHDVQYNGRPVMKRGSLVEMSVPYADPNPPYQRKCALDVGDYGLGYCANSLELGKFATQRGREAANAPVCIVSFARSFSLLLFEFLRQGVTALDIFTTLMQLSLPRQATPTSRKRLFACTKKTTVSCGNMWSIEMGTTSRDGPVSSS